MRFASFTIGEKIPFFAVPIITTVLAGVRRLAVTPTYGRGANADAATAQSARRRVRTIVSDSLRVVGC